MTDQTLGPTDLTDTPKKTLSLLDFGWREKLPLVRQAEAAECGLACLAMIIGFHGTPTDLPSIRRRFPVSLKGSTLVGLMEIAGQLELSARPLRIEVDELYSLKCPAILHWDLNHFVVLKSVGRNHVTIHDPARGVMQLSLEEASKHITGIALELIPTTSFQKRKSVEKISLSDFWKQTIGLRRSLAHVFVLAFVLQLFVLSAPFYSQLVIDEVLTRLDVNLLGTITMGFLILMVLQTIVSVTSEYASLYLGTQLNFQVTTNLFHHLTRLPMSWFERRHIGDVVSRFGSTGPIQGVLTGGIVGSILNVFTFVGSLVLLLLYSPLLTGIIVGALAIYLLLRLALYSTLKRLSEDQIIASAKQNSTFMETIRGMQSIKLFGRESEREAVWRNQLAEAVNIGIRSSKLGIWIGVANTFIFGIENIAIMYLGASAVIGNMFSIGALVAFIAYKGQFEGAAISLVDGAISFKLLDIHLERLADIGLQEREEGFETRVVGTIDDPLADTKAQVATQIGNFIALKGAVGAEHIRFRYAEGEPWVLDDVSFTIRPGEFVSIAGPSGGGKTTLLKLLLGLHDPIEGTVTYDGYSIERMGRQALRRQCGVVMQDDQLLSGSIAENISFFEPDRDWERIEDCAKKARVHEDVVAMPMGYQSLIGDMGTTLSGGQKQRVLLARALYRYPKILFLDEGTANLDARSEGEILAELRTMQITRICIAHRPAALELADRVLWVDEGKVQELTYAEIMAHS